MSKKSMTLECELTERMCAIDAIPESDEAMQTMLDELFDGYVIITGNVPGAWIAAHPDAKWQQMVRTDFNEILQ